MTFTLTAVLSPNPTVLFTKCGRSTGAGRTQSDDGAGPAEVEGILVSFYFYDINTSEHQVTKKKVSFWMTLGGFSSRSLDPIVLYVQSHKHTTVGT